MSYRGHSSQICTIFFIIFTAGVVGVVEESLFQDDGLPFFVSVPTVIKTTENDTVVLPCYVENLGDNRVQWWRGDLLLADSNGSSSIFERVKMGPDNGLEVSTVIADDTGEYECRVERPLPWNPLVQKHAIEVLYNPTVSLSPPGPVIDVKIGEEVIIICDAYAFPTPTITWSHQGNIPEDSSSLSGVRSSRLTFKASSRRLSGLYTCTAQNGVGNPVSATVRLRILHPPEVSVDKEWVHASPGIRAELTCIVIAEPSAKVAWSRGKHPVGLNQRISRKVNADRHSLVFQRVHSFDLTTYTCTATNVLGSDQRTVLLTGVAREAVFKSEVTSVSEDSYTLIWEVESYTPIINFKLEFRRVTPDEPSNWTEVVIPADGASALVHSKSFSLGGLSPGASYEAVVRSRNAYGWSPPSDVFPFFTRGADVPEPQTTDSLPRSVDEKREEIEMAMEVQEVAEKAAIHSAQPRPHWTQAESTTQRPFARSKATWIIMPSIFLVAICSYITIT